MGRLGETAAALHRGYAGRSSLVSSPDYVKLPDLVKYRLGHPDYLRDPAYSSLMTETFSHIRPRCCQAASSCGGPGGREAGIQPQVLRRELC